jgi:hypothetical protein
MITRRDVRAANLRRFGNTSAGFELVIDELVLRGFPAVGRYAIGDALSLELTGLLARAGTQSFERQDTSLPLLNPGRITLPPDATPLSVGTQLARTVYGSLKHADGGKR